MNGEPIAPELRASDAWERRGSQAERAVRPPPSQRSTRTRSKRSHGVTSGPGGNSTQ
jgi:hypothetical protein